jgi:hypothetical protein
MRWVLLFLLALSLQAQSTTTQNPLCGEAREVLAAVDARIHAPLSAKALRFDFRPRIKTANGEESQARFRVRYSWRGGVGDRIDFLDDESKLLEHAPNTPEHLQAEVRKQHLEAARGLAGFVRGRTLVETWNHCSGRVERTRVNGRDEILLLLEPVEKKVLRQARIYLDKRGVPWKVERALLDGARILQHPQYELIDTHFALEALQHVEISANPRDAARQFAWDIQWQRVAGQLVPSSITKLSKDAKEPGLGLSEILELCLDEDVPPFEPERAPR